MPRDIPGTGSSVGIHHLAVENGAPRFRGDIEPLNHAWVVTIAVGDGLLKLGSRVGQSFLVGSCKSRLLLGLHVRECRLGTLSVLFDLVARFLALLLAIEDRLVLRVVDQVVLLCDLVVDLGNLSFGVGLPKETLDAGPYFLKESTESVPSLACLCRRGE